MNNINTKQITSLLFLTLSNFVQAGDFSQKERPNPSFRRLSKDDSAEQQQEGEKPDYSSVIVIIVVVLVLLCLCSSFFKRRKANRSSKQVTNIKSTQKIKKINKKLEEINKKLKNQALEAEKKSQKSNKNQDQQDIENQIALQNIQVEHKFVEGIPIETIKITNKKNVKQTAQTDIPMIAEVVI